MNTQPLLLEREADAARIGGVLRSAKAGSGGNVLIEGAAGIGKTSLLAAAAELAEAERMTVLRARGGVLEREFALGVVIQLLAPVIDPLTGRERERAFAGAAGLARPLFEDVPDRAAADGRLFARLHGLHWLCARLAEQRPLALLVDDAHWADEDSLRFLDYLEARIEEIPACVVVAVRTGETAAAPEALAGLMRREPRIRPSPLSPAAIAELVRASLGDETEDEVCAECARATAGNPLLARRLIAALAERDGSVDAGAIAAVGPPSVARFVAAQLERRPPAVGEVARALAILGDDASLADAAAVAGVDRATAADAVDALIDAELLHPGLPPRFVHPIIVQALHDSVPGGRAGAAPPGRRARAGAGSGAVRARGRAPAGRRPGPRALGVRCADGRGAPGRRPRRSGPGGAVPAPRARRGGAGVAAAGDAARPGRGRVGRQAAGGGRPHGGGARAVGHADRARAGGARPLDGALPRRGAPGGDRRQRGRSWARRTGSIGSCAWRSSSRPPPPGSSAGSPAWRRSAGCSRSNRR